MNTPRNVWRNWEHAPPAENRHWRWAKTVIRWDGLLPVAVGAAAPIVNLAVPRHPEVGMLIAVFLPIFGFFLRLSIGNQYFAANRHFAWQKAIFLIAIFFLVLLDALLILFRLIPGGVAAEDWRIWCYMYTSYVLIMSLALYPQTEGARDGLAEASINRGSQFRN